MDPTDQPNGDVGRESASGLCSTCRSLDLRPDKFILGSTYLTSRPSTAQSLHGDSPRSSRVKMQLTSGNGESVFSSLEIISQRRDDCVLCNVLWQAVNRYSGDKAPTTGPLGLAWELDGRSAGEDDRLVNRTRRIRVSWADAGGKSESVCLVLVGAQNDGRDDCAFLGREEVPFQDKLDIMKGWIDVCAEKHEQNCADELGTRAEFEKLVVATYFGVIDVVDMQLKPLPTSSDGKPEKYVALSYVWGDAADPQGRHMTTRRNVMTRIQTRGLRKDWGFLPKTIQDAVLLARAIGQRYLWVDSLCIVQDSTSSWELNAKAMHLVYGNAFFTICAADGDARTGLRAVSPILSEVRNYDRMDSFRSSMQSTPERLSRMARYPFHKNINDSIFSPNQNIGSPASSAWGSIDGGPMEDDEKYKSLVIDYSPAIRLLVSRSPENVIQCSSWDRRGWTFQERLLSRRCLIFAEGQAYFQCRSTVMSQDKYSDSSKRGWSLDWTNSPLRTLGELKKRAFWFYMKCIGLYTGRQLTKPRDILTAFQGSSWLLEQYLKAPLLYGLPRSHFDLALLWTPVSTLCRRKLRNGNSDRRSSSASSWQDHFRCNECLSNNTGFGDKEFPSWSWCGWMHGKCEYEVGMLDGCFPHVQGWLKSNTWILWYVRDQEGNLRPLWDRDSLREDISEDDRWRGYSGHDASTTSPTTSIASSPGRIPQSRRTDNFSRSGEVDVSDMSDTDTLTQRSPDERARGVRFRSGPPDVSRFPPPERGHWVRRSNVPYLDSVAPRYYDGNLAGDYFTSKGESHYYEDDTTGDSPRRRSRSSRGFVPGPGMPGTHYPPYPPPRNIEPPLPGPPPPRERERTQSSRKTKYIRDIQLDEDQHVRYPPPRTSQTSVTGRTSTTYFSDSDADRHKTPDSDVYGRPIRQDARAGTDFTGILPENPFGVNRGPFSIESDLLGAEAMPVLQFWTFRHLLNISIQDSQGGARPEAGGLCQCDIRDSSGDWCGVIKLPWSYAETRLEQSLFFVALSEAKSFTMEECPVWNYYITKEREDSEWDLYFVLLLERNNERALWERVALGKVFKAAFSGSVWDEIKLG